MRGKDGGEGREGGAGSGLAPHGRGVPSRPLRAVTRQRSASRSARTVRAAVPRSARAPKSARQRRWRCRVRQHAGEAKELGSAMARAPCARPCHRGQHRARPGEGREAPGRRSAALRAERVGNDARTTEPTMYCGRGGAGEPRSVVGLNEPSAGSEEPKRIWAVLKEPLMYSSSLV